MQMIPYALGSHPRSPLRIDLETLQQQQEQRRQFAVQSEASRDIPIRYSVYFGGITLVRPQLRHRRFETTVSEQVFRGKGKGKGAGGERPSQLKRVFLRRFAGSTCSEEMGTFRALVSLAVRFEQTILDSLERKTCPICCERLARFLVHRPLCAVRNGFVDLADSEDIQKLMAAISSDTADTAGGNVEGNWRDGEKAFVCELAVPICEPEGECHRIVARNVERYLAGIRQASREPSLSEGDTVRLSQCSSTPAIYDEIYDERQTEKETNSTITNLATIGVTAFIGRPLLRLSTPIPRGQLSCLVLSSQWPRSMLPTTDKSEATKAIDYCRISAAHEETILSAGDYRCAVCPGRVTARSLVHRPISYARPTAATDAADGRRSALKNMAMYLFQHVEGRWTYRERCQALGVQHDAQIFDFIVPVCETGGVCEDVARTSAREFIKLLLLLPGTADLGLVFSGLNPDTDLADNSIEGLTTTKPDCENVHLQTLVSKIGPRGFMSDGIEIVEDPHSPVLTISKLRVQQEAAKREYLKSIEKHTGDRHVPSDMVWIFERSTTTTATAITSTATAATAASTANRGSTSTSSSLSSSRSRQSQSQSETLRHTIARQLLFPPLLSMEFLLVGEAVHLREALRR
ncbi:hypothetical protein ASPZODRAFT_134999 [Penicilliopsis zonata CBS 506.65]|uniref:Uncharacterized protein n=1 Tax=Penicilliopsis zonata CBS 506.65 TaxID=1073090 RepID=A0A1L9SAM8_9EURO|nr:hypothetical protein ASPZODRAFT_134999 [Penicilliopsis zonata CBS 506.65]OJJ44214.1 hypothetical protein ASPZODRAFT_134999 [Penicilliopsis zonata CBS 506.65]